MTIRVGVVGISGFGGGEALRLVAGHPSFELVYAAGEGSAGSLLADRFPGVPPRLAGLVIEKWDPASLPPLDLLIRTSGEVRLSNFLLWQAAYAEMWFTDVLWPDFTPAHLEEALTAFSRRERRYGGR